MKRRHARARKSFFASLLLSGVLSLCASSARAQRLSPLAKAPDWSQLDGFQETITHDGFEHLLNNVYAPENAAIDCIEIKPDSALIKKTISPPSFYELHFAANDGTAKLPPRYWKPVSELPANQATKPLAGLKVALDPGHLGGKWAKMEERWFQIGESLPVTEGDMTLRVAKLLAPKLRALGADVSFVRDSSVPETALRPDDLHKTAEQTLDEEKANTQSESGAVPNTANDEQARQSEADKLFYRIGEIRTRALLVNRQIKPDIVLCLHFNAEAWGDPARPTFVDRNHMHLLVNGCYNTDELSHDDVRFEMLVKLLDRSSDTEIAASEKIAAALALATGLPPYEYHTPHARRVGDDPYVWTRNLLANRLYRCPVVYIEPYVMNSKPVFDRVQLGDYEGEREIDGVMRKSIYREYADAVADGLAEYCRSVARR